MNENSNFEINVDRIYDNLELLENGHVYEDTKNSGNTEMCNISKSHKR